MDFDLIFWIIVAAIILGMFIYYKVTGVNPIKVAALSRPVISSVAAAIDAVQKVWPNDTLNIVHKVLVAGATATELAEQAWLMGQLERDERNAYAKKYAYDKLAEAGIVVDDRVEAIVNGIIEATCMLLPHGVQPEQMDIEE